MVVIAAHHDSYGLLSEVWPTRCNSRLYDGLLYDWRLSVASFTTTQYNGGQPTMAQFPSYLSPGEAAHRHGITFDPDDYDKFLVADVPGQVGFLLLSRDDYWEQEMAARVRNEVPEAEDPRYWNFCFPNGQANDYSDHPASRHTHCGKVFVSVHFCHAFQVEYQDTFPKSGITNRQQRVVQSYRQAYVDYSYY